MPTIPIPPRAAITGPPFSDADLPGRGVAQSRHFSGTRGFRRLEVQGDRSRPFCGEDRFRRTDDLARAEPGVDPGSFGSVVALNTVRMPETRPLREALTAPRHLEVGAGEVGDHALALDHDPHADR